MAQIGYVRVSTVDQNLVRQLDGIALDKVFSDKASGKNIDGRPALAMCIDYCREGDTLHVHSMDRLARNLEDLLKIVRVLTDKGVVIRFEKEALAFDGKNNPMSILMLQIMGAVAQFERALILERQREGIAQAKKAGKYAGRKPVPAEKIEKVTALVRDGFSVTAACKQVGISRATYYVAINNGKEEGEE